MLLSIFYTVLLNNPSVHMFLKCQVINDYKQTEILYASCKIEKLQIKCEVLSVIFLLPSS